MSTVNINAIILQRLDLNETLLKKKLLNLRESECESSVLDTVRDYQISEHVQLTVIIIMIPYFTIIRHYFSSVYQLTLSKSHVTSTNRPISAKRT